MNVRAMNATVTKVRGIGIEYAKTFFNADNRYFDSRMALKVGILYGSTAAGSKQSELAGRDTPNAYVFKLSTFYCEGLSS